MSSRLESRIRELLQERRTAGAPTPPVPSAARPIEDRLKAAAGLLGGEVVDGEAGASILVERFYPLSHCHGLVRLADVPGTSLAAAPELTLLGARPEPVDRSRPLVFVDLETTGIAGGAGTYAFLVGCGFFEPHGFRIQQFLLPGYQHERPLLAAVEARVRASAALVTYNGRTFDVPVLETRYLFHRLTPPFADCGHLDMLHPARRFWRGLPPGPAVWPDSDGCRLTTLERTLFGVRRIGDVPGFEIPSRYFHYVRTGEAGPLEPVLEHNRLDLLSLAIMTAQALRLLAGAPETSTTARESLGAGRLLERAGRMAAAERCYRDAAARARFERGPDTGEVRAEALRLLARCCRRAERFGEALEAWGALAAERTTPPALRREALEAIAIHHEHRTKDLDEAYRYARLSLAERVGLRSMDAGRYRLARLSRKLERRASRQEPTLLPQS